MGGGGGSFLGTAAAAAAGMVGGSLLLGSIRSMMGGGGNQQSFGDSASAGDGVAIAAVSKTAGLGRSVRRRSGEGSRHQRHRLVRTPRQQ